MGNFLGFLFGRQAKIFDKDGNVRHSLPKEKWDAWQARYLHSEELNWRHHSGVRAKDPGQPEKPQNAR